MLCFELFRHLYIYSIFRIGNDDEIMDGGIKFEMVEVKEEYELTTNHIKKEENEDIW